MWHAMCSDVAGLAKGVKIMFVFRSEAGHSYSNKELINGLQSKEYLYDVKQHVSGYANRPFSVSEMNEILADEGVFTAYRALVERKQGRMLQSCLEVKGDTLGLMYDLLDAIEQGAISNGSLGFFLVSDDFIEVISEPIGKFYAHLSKYPAEKEALFSISERLPQEINFISYLNDIIGKGLCSSGFPFALAEMLSLVVGLKMYLRHEEQRAAVDAKDDNAENNQEQAFFDAKPINNYLGIKIDGLTSKSRSVNTIKRFIDYLDSIHISYHDVPRVAIQDNKLLVYTASDRAFKIRLRDKIISDELHVETENVSGEYRFFIADLDELEEKLAVLDLAERDEDGIFKQLGYL